MATGAVPLLPSYIPPGTSMGIALVGSAVLACWRDALNSRLGRFGPRKTSTRSCESDGGVEVFGIAVELRKIYLGIKSNAGLAAALQLKG